MTFQGISPEMADCIRNCQNCYTTCVICISQHPGEEMMADCIKTCPTASPRRRRASTSWPPAAPSTSRPARCALRPASAATKPARTWTTRTASSALRLARSASRAAARWRPKRPATPSVNPRPARNVQLRLGRTSRVFLFSPDGSLHPSLRSMQGALRPQEVATSPDPYRTPPGPPSRHTVQSVTPPPDRPTTSQGSAPGAAPPAPPPSGRDK